MPHLEAIRDAKLAYEPKVVGIDGTKEGLEAVNEGRMLGTIINDYQAYAQALLIGSSPNGVVGISRYPMKNRLVWGLRDRFEPGIAEAVRAKRVTDTVSGLCVTLSSKASNSR